MLARDLKGGEIVVRFKHYSKGWIGPDAKGDYAGFLPSRAEINPGIGIRLVPLDKSVSSFGLLSSEEVELQSEEVVEIDASELKVGDVVVGYRGKGDPNWIENKPDFPVEIREIKMVGNEMLADGYSLAPTRLGEHTRCFDIDQFEMRIRARATSKPSGSWNGKCHRCGMGTYTGFLQIEHEGGTCRG